MLDLRPLVLVAIPGQLMLAAAGAIAWLAGFGRVSALPVASAIITLVALAAAGRPTFVARTMTAVALLANLAGLVTLAWYAFWGLPPAAGPAAAVVLILLAAGLFGPAVLAFVAAFRPAQRVRRLHW